MLDHITKGMPAKRKKMVVICFGHNEFDLVLLEHNYQRMYNRDNCLCPRHLGWRLRGHVGRIRLLRTSRRQLDDGC